MSALTTETFRVDPAHSSFGFSIRHSGVYRFRGTMSDVTATLRDGMLEGAARVDSISIVQPDAFRAQVLGPDFFDALRYPEVTFRSTDLHLWLEGGAEVDGELCIKGITRSVTASGRYEPPVPGPFGSVAAGLSLHTTFDRRDFGFDWQMAMPGGSDVLGWDVDLDIELRLERDE